ncbi:hypothetical protein GCM10009680_56450 [Streptomyces yatensis]|uniref:Uncharacterized protein n=1 Tax=Streptomyces yatensis TaxID=155177 RepID=A0ABP4UMZ7_9ACTN
MARRVSARIEQMIGEMESVLRHGHRRMKSEDLMEGGMDDADPVPMESWPDGQRDFRVGQTEAGANTPVVPSSIEYQLSRTTPSEARPAPSRSQVAGIGAFESSGACGTSAPRIPCRHGMRGEVGERGVALRTGAWSCTYAAFGVTGHGLAEYGVHGLLLGSAVGRGCRGL